jgi:hypothetical protein
MAKGITGQRRPDMSVTARRTNLKPSRGEGSGDILKSVPDSILRNLGGTHLEREVTRSGWDNETETEVSMPDTERTFISHDMVHHEMKWRGLV